MYDRFSISETVDDARPPTHAAIVEHSKRATFQAACIWSCDMESQIGQETPAEWG